MGEETHLCLWLSYVCTSPKYFLRAKGELSCPHFLLTLFPLAAGRRPTDVMWRVSESLSSDNSNLHVFVACIHGFPKLQVIAKALSFSAPEKSMLTYDSMAEEVSEAHPRPGLAAVSDSLKNSRCVKTWRITDGELQTTERSLG